MASLGTVGTNLGGQVSRGVLMGEPWWWDPANRAIGMKDQETKGIAPGVGGRFQNGFPSDVIPIIVASYGSPGGGVSIF